MGSATISKRFLQLSVELSGEFETLEELPSLEIEGSNNGGS